MTAMTDHRPRARQRPALSRLVRDYPLTTVYLAAVTAAVTVLAHLTH